MRYAEDRALAVDFSAFVGLPWQDKGRDEDGCDCWGLLRLVYREVGIDLPNFSDGYGGLADKVHIRALIDGGSPDWIEVSDPRALDGVLMMIAGDYHVGVMIDRRLVLHLPAERDSVIEPIDRFRMVLRGFYRHRALA